MSDAIIGYGGECSLHYLRPEQHSFSGPGLFDHCLLHTLLRSYVGLCVSRLEGASNTACHHLRANVPLILLLCVNIVSKPF